MKNRKSNLLLFFTLFLVFSLSQAFAEEAGIVTLMANINANNTKNDMQISVVNLDTKEVVQKEEVSTNFFSSLSINSRYMVYFKKTGHPAMRMIVDTHTKNIANYRIHFSINLINLTSNLETGISIPVGTLLFDDVSSNFILQPSASSNCNRVAITSAGIDNGIVKF